MDRGSCAWSFFCHVVFLGASYYTSLTKSQAGPLNCVQGQLPAQDIDSFVPTINGGYTEVVEGYIFLTRSFIIFATENLFCERRQCVNPEDVYKRLRHKIVAHMIIHLVPYTIHYEWERTQSFSIQTNGSYCCNK